jgi:regulator of sigma E protease
MSVLIFIVMLLVLIIVHELGHFFSAKRFGIRVDEFGIGFPPRALTLARRDGTDYTLNWLPFGGFVRIWGEDAVDVPENAPDRGRSFGAQPAYVQAIVLAAGVGMNIAFGWLLFALAFVIGVPGSASAYPGEYVHDPALTIVAVLPDSPAAQAGLMPGDRLLDVYAQAKYVELSPENVVAFIQERDGMPITFTYARKEKLETVIVTPVTNVVAQEPERPAVGISMDMVATIKLPLHVALIEAASRTFNLLLLITQGVGGFIVSAFTLNADLSQVSGPVGIAGAVDDAAALGTVSLLIFAAVISLHLAVINLLPVPALDGGRLLFLLIETIKGSPIRPTVAKAVNAGGFILLILLMVLVTISDIGKLL